MFRHPKYYKELRKRNKLDQAISSKNRDGECERATGPGLQQAIEETVPHNDIEEATSFKLYQQGSGAASYKLSSFKRQAASPKQQASSSKPQATSSLILEPS